MTSPTPLNAEAEAYRKDLADWISQSQLQTDYVLDEKGNRIYSRNRIASHVEKLLQALGLSVCPRYWLTVYSCANVPIGFRFYYVAILRVHADRSWSPNGSIFHSNPNSLGTTSNDQGSQTAPSCSWLVQRCQGPIRTDSRVWLPSCGRHVQSPSRMIQFSLLSASRIFSHIVKGVDSVWPLEHVPEGVRWHEKYTVYPRYQWKVIAETVTYFWQPLNVSDITADVEFKLTQFYHLLWTWQCKECSKGPTPLQKLLSPRRPLTE